MTAQTIATGGGWVLLVILLLLKLWRDRARDTTPLAAAADETTAASGPEVPAPSGLAPSPPATAETSALAEVVAAAERLMAVADRLVATLEAGAPELGVAGAGGSGTAHELSAPSAPLQPSKGRPEATDPRPQAAAAAASWVDDEIITAPGWPVPGGTADGSGDAPIGGFGFPTAGGVAGERDPGAASGVGDRGDGALAATPTEVAGSAVPPLGAMSEAEKPPAGSHVAERPPVASAPFAADEALAGPSGGAVGASGIARAPGGALADLEASPGWDTAGDLTSRADWDAAAPDPGDAARSAGPQSWAGVDPSVAGELAATDGPLEAGGDDAAELDWSPTASGPDDAPWSLSKPEMALGNEDERALTPFEAEVDQWVAAAAEWQQQAATQPGAAAAPTPAPDEAGPAGPARAEGPGPAVPPTPSVPFTEPAFATPAAPAAEETAATSSSTPAEAGWVTSAEENPVAWWDERDVELVHDEAGGGPSGPGEHALQPTLPVEVTGASDPSRAPAGPCLTIAEAAAWLSVDHKTVRRMIDRGEIEALRIGRVFRIERDALRQALAYRSAE